MVENWTLIYSNSELLQVKLAEDILKQNDIVSNIISKQDPVFPSIGSNELYAKPEDAARAKEILASNDIQ